MAPDIHHDPFPQLLKWVEDAAHCGLEEPAATVLATTDEHGHPSARVVLVRHVDRRGLVFYTNLESNKGVELKTHPYAALCVYWAPLQRQLRVRGPVERISDEEADAYFRQRPRESQIGAWASHQSRPLSGREELLSRFEEHVATFAGRDVPRPPHWSGTRVVPETIEFWEAGDHRLHHRELYTRDGAVWRHELLNP